MIGYLKIFLVVPILFLYFILATPLYPFLSITPYKTRFVLNHMVHYLCKVLLFILNVRIKVFGESPKIESGKLIVCNHVSYLDILIIASKIPTCFVTSVEMKETPGLGLLCKLGGCVFVERRSRDNIDKEIEEIKVAMEKGLSVMFFPEAKSTSGERVYPFKRSLFHAAVTAKSDTIPLCINYTNLNGKSITLDNKDLIFWYGSMTFGDHFLRVCSHKNIDVDLAILSEITESDISGDSKVLRDKSFQVISKKYRDLA